MNYAAKQRQATRLIRRAGAPATLAWDNAGVVPGAPNVVTDLAAVPEQLTGTVTLVAFPFKLRNLGSDRFADRTDILTRQRRFLMSAANLPVTPTVGMRILDWEAQTWTIDGLAPSAFDGETTVLYTGTMKQ